MLLQGAFSVWRESRKDMNGKDRTFGFVITEFFRIFALPNKMI